MISKTKREFHARSQKVRTRIEDKVVSDHTMKACKGSSGVVDNIGTTALPLGKDPVTYLIEEWVGPKANLYDLEKRKTPLAPIGIGASDPPYSTLITMLHQLLPVQWLQQLQICILTTQCFYWFRRILTISND